MTIIAPPLSIPFWQSKIIMGALFSALLKLLALLGIGDLTSDPVLVDNLVIIASFLGDAFAFGGRLTQKVAPPVTVGK